MRKKTSIVLLAAGHACVDVYQGAVAALVPLFVAERAYTYAAASGVVLAATLLSSVAQPLFGALTDRWPLPWLLPASTVLGGLGIAAAGVAGSYPLTLACVALSGLGVAAYHPESARVARRAGRGSHVAMGWFSLGGNVGFAAAPLLVAACGLRLSPLLVVPALAGAALCVPVLRALAADASGGPAASVAGVAGVAGGAGNGTGGGTGVDTSAKSEISPPSTKNPVHADDRGSFARLTAAVVFRSVAFVGLSTFIAVYARQQLGGGPAAGTAALVVLYLGGALGTVAGGRLAERWDRVTVVRHAYLLTVAAVAGIVLVPGPAVYLFVAATSAGLYVPFSLQVTLGQDYLPTRVGTAAGVTLGLAVSAGGVAAPAIGALADATSLRAALAPLIVMPALAWLALRTVPEPPAITA
ncbi:MFS transporter [Dactylosporangium sp. NPDC048998]|uniref:MFS transporter n=1 Tax=Dactylosporangium sp. NPDC048998 TaxID=3363976 RepID=UPI0037233F0D